MKRLAILAPLSGWVRPLSDVPDAVFSAGMAGQGVAIDPVDGVLHAPCGGVVVLAGNARHALSVRHDGGLAVLMHVGIDTVALRGEGFELLVADGQRVEAGDALLRFDLDRIARGAASAVTPVLVEAECHAVRTGEMVRAGEVLFEVDVPPSAEFDRLTPNGNREAGLQAAVRGQLSESSATVRGEPVEPHSTTSRAFRIPFDHGLHARPAAKLVAALRGLDARVTLRAHGRDADARSAISLMALGVQTGDRVEAIAAGRDARAALDALAAVLADAGVSEPSAAAPAPAMPPRELTGTPAVRGIAVGTAHVLRDEEFALPVGNRGAAVERAEFERALGETAHALQARCDELADAHLALLQDPELERLVQAGLQRGANAAQAWRSAVDDLVARLAGLADARMRERVADLRDLERRVLRTMLGMDGETVPVLPPDAIVFADELLPSQFAALDASRLAGIVSAKGGATSHVALLAAARNVPMLIGAGARALEVQDGQAVALDASRGRVLIDPPPAVLEALRTQARERAAREAADRAACAQPAVLRDGTRIAVHANLGAVEEVESAVAQGAEGCGLLRTEFLFLERSVAPDEDEQYEAYAAAAAAFDGRPLTIRTLDVGGDKPLAYLPMAREENPALGLRGLRVQLREPALLRSQLRAILRAAADGNVRVMVPMVNDVGELRAVRAALLEAARELESPLVPPLGVMIETPAAALLAGQFAREADFLSIGSNDLSQYVLAMDRGHPAFAQSLDALHPAVLRAIAQVARAGREAGCSVSVCGGLGSDVDALPLLVGLGIREVSAVPAAVPRVKRVLRGLDASDCEALAARALDCIDAAQVRALALPPLLQGEGDARHRMKPMDALQALGRALMLPIAVLPVAGLLLRLGQPDLLDLAFVAAAGDAIFSHLGLLFAIGVAVGLARENHGAAGLAGVVGFLIASEGTRVILGTTPAEVAKLGVPLGILSGVIAGVLYNRYHDIKLPAYLAFFGGRRFVPIASGFAALFVAALFGFAWPTLTSGIDALSHGVTQSGSLGLFVYGVLNRLLIVTGLHHILNNVAWFLVGDFGGVTGDLKRFFAGDPDAGAFMSGFFPVMMFGLPAACLAMYRAAKPERRKAVGGLLMSMALTSFLTGVTEPIEFSFMFLAPLLYAVHAVLTGVSMALMDAMDVRLGFSFSAGLFDYVLNFDRAQKPWLLLPIGALYFAVYYGLFAWCIKRFDLPTPGRERESAAPAMAHGGQGAAGFVAALGGRANLVVVDACTTRLRLELADRTKIDEAALRALGARGVLKVGEQGLQVVLGPIADQTAGEIRDFLHGAAPLPSAVDIDALRAALGGTDNIAGIEVRDARLMLVLRDAARVDESALHVDGLRGIARPSPNSLHLLHGDAAQLAAAL